MSISFTLMRSISATCGETYTCYSKDTSYLVGIVHIRLSPFGEYLVWEPSFEKFCSARYHPNLCSEIYEGSYGLIKTFCVVDRNEVCCQLQIQLTWKSLSHLVFSKENNYIFVKTTYVGEPGWPSITVKALAFGT